VTRDGLPLELLPAIAYARDCTGDAVGELESALHGPYDDHPDAVAIEDAATAEALGAALQHLRQARETLEAVCAANEPSEASPAAAVDEIPF
jgi:hypothetical protein